MAHGAHFVMVQRVAKLAGDLLAAIAAGGATGEEQVAVAIFELLVMKTKDAVVPTEEVVKECQSR